MAQQVQEPVPRPAGRRAHPQLGRRPPQRRPRGRRHRRRGRVPQHGAAVLPELRAVRRPPTARASTSTGSPASGRTTAGSPTSATASRAARRHRPDLPQRRRRRDRGRARGSRSTGCAAACSSPTLPPDVDYVRRSIDPAYDPLWKVVRGPRRRRQHARRHRRARLRQVTRPRRSLFITEVSFYSQRPFVQFILAGVFERFPKLKFVMTETGCHWMPPLLKQLDPCSTRSARPAAPASCVRHRARLPPSATEYFRAELLDGRQPAGPGRRRGALRTSASTGSCGGATTRTTRAPGRSPASTCARCSARIPEDELRQLLAGNAAELYGFDLDALAPLADEFGPTVDEIAEPLDRAPRRRQRGAAPASPPGRADRGHAEVGSPERARVRCRDLRRVGVGQGADDGS